MPQWTVETASAPETRVLGDLLGRLFASPLLILLSGDLGTGKTCLTQGLARGLGVPPQEPVTSPSYTLLNVHAGRLPLYHFDLYRLAGDDDLLDLGMDDYLHADGVTVIEWADRAPGLPPGDLNLQMSRVDADRRRITFTAEGEKGALLLQQLAHAWRERGEDG